LTLQKGEQMAQACANAWFRQLTPLGAAWYKTLIL
jgi:hypothetical protein